MTDVSLSDWLPICVKGVQVSVELAGDLPVFAEIAIGPEIVASAELRESLVEAYSGLGVAGFILWIDDLDEAEADLNTLRGLLEFSQSLGASGKKEVINLHGGYFSLLMAGNLGQHALTGVSHGPEYGERRGVVPVGGGIPIARYYLPALHRRVKYKEVSRCLDALGFLSSTAVFHERVCGCRECVDTLEGDVANFTRFGSSTAREVKRGHGIVRMDYPTGEAKVRCLRHYLERKSLEFTVAATQEPATQAAELLESADIYQQAFGLDGVAHLRRWYQVLEG